MSLKLRIIHNNVIPVVYQDAKDPNIAYLLQVREPMEEHQKTCWYDGPKPIKAGEDKYTHSQNLQCTFQERYGPKDLYTIHASIFCNSQCFTRFLTLDRKRIFFIEDAPLLDEHQPFEQSMMAHLSKFVFVSENKYAKLEKTPTLEEVKRVKKGHWALPSLEIDPSYVITVLFPEWETSSQTQQPNRFLRTALLPPMPI